MSKKTSPAPTHLADLAGNPNNPRRISEDSANALKISLEQFGDISCIVYNVRSEQMVGGHQRKAVITQLIGENPELIITDQLKTPTKTGTVAEGYVEANGEKYKVRFVDWDEKKEAAANLQANNPLSQGEWDFDLLPTTIDLAMAFEGIEGLRIDDLAEKLLESSFSEPTKNANEEVDTDAMDATGTVKLMYTEENYQKVLELMAKVKETGKISAEELFMSALKAQVKG